MRAQHARIRFLKRGELRPLQTEISEILEEQPAAAKEITLAMLDCAILERNPAQAKRALAVVQSEGLLDTYISSNWSRDWLIGVAALTFGDLNNARSSFLSARAIEQKAVEKLPYD